ncbi:prepilin peptidase [Thiohalophilus thiocyanatoxydans]|uniref:Prepilin leader peptidase/N-methyltransferase n=1 Tax=Thiohalophilus thiocyanatoxydans TaxID=381308 RepID=A0A4R8IKA6_9GAMM|nr:A24 family peptidase [Thiohalophilus thiocyanatoxydans]TDY01166.1 leader peptidase (prepilin peptidase)/N-methyltransferase [Thiohalophilus thiocyanatoxydans]
MNTIALLQASPMLYLAVVFVLGLLVGSFLNVVILRLPRMLHRQWQTDCLDYLTEHHPRHLKAGEPPAEAAPFNLLTPASRCPHCGHAIRARENIPLISYLLLRGRCASCRTPIAVRYPIIELVSGLLAALTAWQFGVTPLAAFAILLTWALIVLTVIDYDHFYLPDNIVLPMLWLGLLLNSQGLFTDIYSALFGAMAGYLALWSVYQLFKLLTGKEGMGYGDFKLLAMLGAWLGWQMLPAVILLSSVVGAVVGITLILFKRHQAGKPIPFGPYLAAAGWIALLWGPQLNQAYLNWLQG